MTKEKQIVALFDYDIIAYRASAAAEKRSIKATHLPSGTEKIFKNRTELKKLLTEKGFEYKEEDYIIEDIQTPEPIENACQILKQQISSIKKAIGATYHEGFIGIGETNFRLKLDLPEKYKGNREDMIRPLLLQEVKNYALNNHNGMKVVNVEADDYLVIKYHEYKRAGHDPVIVTLDKDSWGCVGTKYYDWTQDDPKVIEVPVLGYLEYNKSKKKVEGLGLNFYCYQLLSGDKADNYFPSDLHKQRFGDVAAVNLLKDCKTVDDLFSTVENQYKKWFPEPVTYTSQNGDEVTKNYQEILEMYHRCVYMARKLNDDTTFYSLWEEFK